MQLIIVTILMFYFGLGILATQYLNRRPDRPYAKERWIKLLYYFLILAIVFSAIHFHQARPLAIVIAILGLYELIRAHMQSLRPNTQFCLFVLVYLFIAFSFIRFSSQASMESLFYLYFIVVTFDGFSQICGQLFGKRKLALRISPNKTVEGLIGGLTIALLSSLLLFQPMQVPFLQNLLLTGFVCLSALFGDLLASWYKRHYQLKDYSNLIPGHGGILDRFDSFIFSGAMYLFIFP